MRLLRHHQTDLTLTIVDARCGTSTWHHCRCPLSQFPYDSLSASAAAATCHTTGILEVENPHSLMRQLGAARAQACRGGGAEVSQKVRGEEAAIAHIRSHPHCPSGNLPHLPAPTLVPRQATWPPPHRPPALALGGGPRREQRPARGRGGEEVRNTDYGLLHKDGGVVAELPSAHILDSTMRSCHRWFPLLTVTAAALFDVYRIGHRSRTCLPSPPLPSPPLPSPHTSTIQ